MTALQRKPTFRGLTQMGDMHGQFDQSESGATRCGVCRNFYTCINFRQNLRKQGCKPFSGDIHVQLMEQCPTYRASFALDITLDPMKAIFNRNARLVWLSPIAGTFATTLYLSVRCAFRGDTSDLVFASLVWATRDILVGYCIALPVLSAFRRLGAVNAAWFFAGAALVGGPVGYMLANPVSYAWRPTDDDFEYSPYWAFMCTYMVLNGLTGVAYAYLFQRPVKEVAL